MDTLSSTEKGNSWVHQKLIKRVRHLGCISSNILLSWSQLRKIQFYGYILCNQLPKIWSVPLQTLSFFLWASLVWVKNTAVFLI